MSPPSSTQWVFNIFTDKVGDSWAETRRPRKSPCSCRHNGPARVRIGHRSREIYTVKRVPNFMLASTFKISTLNYSSHLPTEIADLDESWADVFAWARIFSCGLLVSPHESLILSMKILKTYLYSFRIWQYLLRISRRIHNNIILRFLLFLE